MTRSTATITANMKFISSMGTGRRSGPYGIVILQWCSTTADGAKGPYLPE
ncbi:22102_t:CDS:2 [Rhizophagus irregularis]|nr:22102_t:CDS:2 [Rhizophagus irregularis]